MVFVLSCDELFSAGVLKNLGTQSYKTCFGRCMVLEPAEGEAMYLVLLWWTTSEHQSRAFHPVLERSHNKGEGGRSQTDQWGGGGSKEWTREAVNSSIQNKGFKICLRMELKGKQKMRMHGLFNIARKLVADWVQQIELKQQARKYESCSCST